MGTKFSSVSVTGYNASPPADDGSTSASNQVLWSTIKTKLPDPLNTAIAAINSGLVTAFDYSARSISTGDTTIASDHMKTIEIAPTVSSVVTLSLGDATTMAAGYTVNVVNRSNFTCVVGRATASDTIDGASANQTLSALQAVTFKVNSTTNGYVSIQKAGTIPRSYLSGLTLSTAGASATMSIAAGQAADSTNSVMMALAAIAKTTSAWAVGTGNGGIDTGAIANATWYAFYEIMRVDTGVVDVVFSLSGTSPTLPASYTLFRRIGWGLTNGSAQWVAFTQDGDFFQWVTTVGDISANTPGTSAVTRTLTLPPQRVRAVLHVGMTGSLASNYAGLISDLSATDETPAVIGTFLGNFGVSGQATAGVMSSPVQLEIYTNSSKQVRSRVTSSDANVNLIIRTRGWYDNRGKDA